MARGSDWNALVGLSIIMIITVEIVGALVLKGCLFGYLLSGKGVGCVIYIPNPVTHFTGLRKGLWVCAGTPYGTLTQLTDSRLEHTHMI